MTDKTVDITDMACDWWSDNIDLDSHGCATEYFCLDKLAEAMEMAYQAGLNSRGSEAVDIVHIAKKFIDGDESLQGLEMALDDYFDTDINNEE